MLFDIDEDLPDENTGVPKALEVCLAQHPCSLSAHPGAVMTMQGTFECKYGLGHGKKPVEMIKSIPDIKKLIVRPSWF